MMKKNVINNLILLFVILTGGIINAPSVKGNVSLKGTSISTTTDFDGNYTINKVDPNAVLIFSYIGYLTKEITVKGNSIINTVLTSDSQKLDEVVVVGYTSQKKAPITGAVQPVD